MTCGGGEENPEGVKQAEVVVGIPSCNEADWIPFVTEQAAIGLATYFPGYRSALINCDHGSRDHTRSAFLSVPTPVPKISLATPAGVTGKGNALRSLFLKALELGARAIVVVDADLRSITPRWIKNLGEPLLAGYGFVSPVYVRPRFDGTITNHFAYPFLRALYGRRIRQPNGGDSGFSAEMARLYLESDLWDEHVSLWGIDIWMTTLAIQSPYRVAQAFLGGPKIHRIKDPGTAFNSMFVDVLYTLFRLLESHEETWTQVRWSKPVPIFGLGPGENESLPPSQANEEQFHQACVEGFARHLPLCRRVLAGEVLGQLAEVARLSFEHFELPPDLWARAVYDFAAAFHAGKEPRADLVRALIPFYLGRACSFLKSTRGAQPHRVEDVIEQQCLIFEETKPYLLERWLETGSSSAG